jgi:hypothetical protein
MAAPTALATLGRYDLAGDPRRVPDYVSACVLAASTAEAIAVPAGAKIVRLAATADVYYSFSDDATVPADTDDGTACELVKQQGAPEWLIVPPDATSLSVIGATADTIVTASFYKA